MVIAGVVASSVLAQDAPKKSRRRGVTYEQAKKADGTVDCASYCAAALKSVTDESKQEKAKSRAEGMFKRLATAAVPRVAKRANTSSSRKTISRLPRKKSERA